MSDQAAVSAGNFLVIAIGAWMLDLPEQSKLVYVYAVYFGLVLLNAAALFAPAPLLRHEVEDVRAYAGTLRWFQLRLAALAALLAAGGLAAAGPWLSWRPAASELSLVLAFLLLQQMADFNRRGAYVFADVRSAAWSSAIALLLRVMLLLIARPDKAADFFLLLAVSAVPGAIWSMVRREFRSTNAVERPLLRQHLHLARWSIANAPLQWSVLHLPVLLLGALAGPAAAAIVASVRSLTTAVNVLLELLETYVPVWMVSRMRAREAAEGEFGVSRLYLFGGVVWIVVTVGIVGFGERLLHLVLGASYAAHWPILLALWVGNGLYFVARVYGVRQRIARRTSVELFGSLGGILTLVAAAPLMSRYGVPGGAAAIVLAQLGSVLFQLGYARRRFKQ